jgi:hypothetical protein
VVRGCIAFDLGSRAVPATASDAVSTPNALISALGGPEKAGLDVLLSSSTLTIFAATWTPQMNLMPHDHLMWANIEIYTGREDNIFRRRSADEIRAYGAEALLCVSGIRENGRSAGIEWALSTQKLPLS